MCTSISANRQQSPDTSTKLDKTSNTTGTDAKTTKVISKIFTKVKSFFTAPFQLINRKISDLGKNKHLGHSLLLYFVAGICLSALIIGVVLTLKFTLLILITVPFALLYIANKELDL